MSLSTATGFTVQGVLGANVDRGDLDEIAGLTRRCGVLATATNAFAASMSGCAVRLRDAFDSEFCVGVQQGIQSGLFRPAVMLRRSLRQTAGALQTYAAALEDIAAEAGRIRQQVTAGLEDAFRCHNTMQRVKQFSCHGWQDVPASSPSVGDSVFSAGFVLRQVTAEDVASWHSSQASWAACTRELESSRAGYEQLRQRRHALNRRIVAVLGETELGSRLGGDLSGAPMNIQLVALGIPTSKYFSDRATSPGRMRRPDQLGGDFGQNPDLPLILELEELSPRWVGKVWNALDEDRRASLVEMFPNRVGALDGLEPLVRVRVNQRFAEQRLQNPTIGDLERFYLMRVVSGEVQLMLYDPEHDRIIQAIGDLGHVKYAVNYVPGTTTTINDFYRGSVQQIAHIVAKDVAGAVVFVHKDGTFPQWTDGGEYLPNNDELVAKLGTSFARFDEGIDVTSIGSRPQHSIGHSVGLAVVLAGEQAGAEFQTVTSLSGIGGVEGWQPNPRTRYVDLTPEIDFIRIARSADFLPLNPYKKLPVAENGFTVVDPEIHPSTPPKDVLERIEVAVEQHSVVASDKTSQKVKTTLKSALTRKRTRT